MGGKWQPYQRKNVMCPFYKKENRQVIYCAGVQENSSIHVTFGECSACKTYKDTKCQVDYESCPVYKALEEMCDG